MDYQYENYTLSIFADNTYSFDSADNKNSYDLVYPNGDYIFRNANMSIYLKENDQIIKSAIVNVNSHYVDVCEKSLVIIGNQFWVILGNEIYNFELPTFHLLWKEELDISMNFAIYNIENDFLIHGEMEIFRVTKTGEIVWRFSGEDIWVNLNGKEIIRFDNNKIYLTDFNDDRYCIDFNGGTYADF